MTTNGSALRALAGTPCPRTVEATWTRGQVSKIARLIGFTARGKRLPLQDRSQLVGLRLYGLVETERSREEPRFHVVHAPAGMLTHNRALLTARILRTPPCPEGFRHPCHQCAKGADACPTATHPRSYVLVACPGCKAESIGDPGEKSGLCLECARAKRMKRPT